MNVIKNNSLDNAANNTDFNVENKRVTADNNADLFSNEEEFPEMSTPLIDLTSVQSNEEPRYRDAAARPTLIRPEVNVERNAANVESTNRENRKKVRYENQEHEREHKFSLAKKQVGLNDTKANISKAFPYDTSLWSNKKVFGSFRARMIHLVASVLACDALSSTSLPSSSNITLAAASLCLQSNSAS